MKIVPVLLSLMFVASVQAQLPGVGAVGAELQAWHYDSATNMVTLKIVNTSHKNITGYNISLHETYADGQVNNPVKGTADEDNIRKQFGDGLFHSRREPG